MLKNIKAVTRDSIIYGFGNLSVKLVGFVLIPIFTNVKYLSFEDFGIMGLLESTSLLLTTMLSLSLSQGITRWYWDEQYKDKQKRMVYSMLVFLFLIGAIFFALSFFIAEPLSKLLFSTDVYSEVIIVVIGASVLQVFTTMLQTMMKLQQKPILFTTTNILRLIFTLVVTIYLVVYRKQSVQGIYMAQVIGSIAFLIVCFRYIKNIVEIKFERQILKEMIFYSSPLVLASISGFMISFQDRYILEHYAGLTKVGIYTFAYRMANTIKFFLVTSVQMAVSPMIYQMMGDQNRLRFYSKYLTYLTYIVAGCTLGLNLFSYEIVKVMGNDPNYWIAYTVIPVIAFSLLFDMLKDTSITGLQIMKKTKLITAIVLSIALLNLGFSFLLIPMWHYYGAAVATLISEIAYFGLIYTFAQKHYKIPYELVKVIKMIAIVAIISIVPFFINDLPLYFRLIIKTSLLVSFPFILVPLNFYEPIEIQRIKEAYVKWRNPLNWRQNLKKH